MRRDVSGSNSGGYDVAMMETAEPRDRHDPAAMTELTRNLTTSWRSRRERKMCPVLVVVTDVVFHELF